MILFWVLSGLLVIFLLGVRAGMGLAAWVFKKKLNTAVHQALK